MRFTILCLSTIAFLLVCFTCAALADDPLSASKTGRPRWTTSRIHGSPDPPSPYRTELAFPHLRFNEPVAMTLAPSGDRMVVVERYGKVHYFDNAHATKKTGLLLDVALALGVKQAQAYGIAFHPQFAKNGFFFISFRREGVKRGTGVARFRVLRDDPWRSDPKSFTVMVDWPSGGHDGGCIKFGPDGYLYIAIGDGGGLHDPRENGQNLGALNSTILRIDVDQTDGQRPYAIPKDNPFTQTPGARPEIWAYGFRQPWKMSFDRQTGDLWTADVGEDLWETVHRVQRGGNYGWSVTEGGHPFRPQRKRGPTPILQPIAEHDHSVFRSITGGFVYRGKKHKPLAGAYIYGDYDTGKIWMLRYDGRQVTEQRELCDSNLRLVGLAEDRHGELFLVDHVGGQIHQLAANEVADTSADFPRKLSETGLFASTEKLTPAPGLIPYDVIAPQWTDGSTKQRYLALPGESQIEFETAAFPYRGGRNGWKFPDGAVLVETHFLQTEQGNPQSRRRLETRILHQERLPGSEAVGDQYWRGYSYIWNDQQTDALLLENPRGLDKQFVIKDQSAPGGRRQQTWHFPGRTECMICHTMAAKYVLGAQTLQMNRDRQWDGRRVNQLDLLQQMGVFTEPLPKTPQQLPHLVDYRDKSQPVEDRARSYLHANCSHCHRNGGGGNADFFVLASLDLAATKILDALPKQGSFHIPKARIVTPGDPYRSLIYYRMAKLGSGRMPRLGSDVVDQVGLDLIHDWISQLATQSQPPAEDRSFAQHIAKIGQSPSDDKLHQQIDQLLGSTIGALHLARAIDHQQISLPARRAAMERGARHEETYIRDVFERYLPEGQRTQRLGNSVEATQILALSGDIQRGRRVFFEQSGLQCRNCHRIGQQGKAVGPDLDQIGRKFNRAQILASILKPSETIDAKYLLYLCETKAGRIHSGLLIEKTEKVVVLKDAQGKPITIPADEVESLESQSKSIMPDLLVRDLTAQQLADLTTFLDSLE